MTYNDEILPIIQHLERLTLAGFSQKTIDELRLGADVLRVAHIYAVRATHLSNDRDEDFFHRKLRMEMNDYED